MFDKVFCVIVVYYQSSRADQDSEVSARDVEAFVQDKRSCLPKSALEQVWIVFL